MTLYLLLCLWPTLIHMLKSKIFIRNQCLASHARQQLYVKMQKKNAVEAVIQTQQYIHTLIFWFVTLCSLVGGHQRNGGNCCLPFQTRRDFYTLTTQTVVSS
jgi:hypothetical protein